VTLWLCIRSGPGRGCYPIPDPRSVPEQLELELHVDEEPGDQHQPATVGPESIE
jgi:hypothetical protein